MTGPHPGVAARCVETAKISIEVIVRPADIDRLRAPEYLISLIFSSTTDFPARATSFPEKPIGRKAVAAGHDRSRILSTVVADCGPFPRSLLSISMRMLSRIQEKLTRKTRGTSLAFEVDLS